MATCQVKGNGHRPKAGYDADFEKIFGRKKLAEPLSLSEVENYRCSVCRLLLRHPQQLSCCGRRSCLCCIDALRGLGKVFICPYCRAKVGDGSENMDYVFTDQSCLNDMKNFSTLCNTKPVPCEWQGLLLQLEAHVEVCDNVEVECTLHCGVVMMRSKLPQHVKFDCALRIIECSLCQLKIQVSMLQEHLLECSKREDCSCPFCKAACKSKQQLHEHVYGGQCTEALLSCPMREALNCRSRVKASQLLQHSVLHVKDIIHDKQKDSIQFETRLTELHGEIDSLKRLCEQQHQSLIMQEQNMAAMQQQMNKLSDIQKREISDLNESLERRLNVAKPLGVHSSDLVHVEDNVRSLQNSFDVMARQIDNLKVQVDENSDIVGSLQTGMDQCTKALTQVNGMVNEVGLKVDILAVRSINGILIWKVNEVEKRIEEAKSGKILSLYSPPFFTSLHGYRMCLRLYLDGDGQGKNTHVSLFLVIMKSDYDDLLQWPFKQKVTLYLLNQNDPYNTKAHVAQAFRPTETSTSFQKPRGPFNTASGFPKFAPVEKLRDQQYVQDDCMYFKVKIDMSDLKAPDFPVY